MKKMKVSSIDEEGDQMTLDAVIANPADPEEKWCEIKFLVDTGAGMTAITTSMAKALGLKYVATAEVGLADGRIIKVNLAYAYLCIHGEGVFTIIGCGGCDVPLLGFDVLRLLQFQLDVAKKRVLRPARRRFKVLSNWIFGRGWSGAGLG